MVTFYEKSALAGAWCRFTNVTRNQWSHIFLKFLLVVRVLFVFTVTFCDPVGGDFLEFLLW